MATDRNGKEIKSGDLLVIQAQVAELRVVDGKDVAVLQDLASDTRFHLPTGSTEILSDLLGDQTSEIEQKLRSAENEYLDAAQVFNARIRNLEQERDSLLQQLQEKQPVSVAREDQKDQPKATSPMVEVEKNEVPSGEQQAQ